MTCLGTFESSDNTIKVCLMIFVKTFKIYLKKENCAQDTSRDISVVLKISNDQTYLLRGNRNNNEWTKER